MTPALPLKDDHWSRNRIVMRLWTVSDLCLQRELFNDCVCVSGFG